MAQDLSVHVFAPEVCQLVTLSLRLVDLFGGLEGLLIAVFGLNVACWFL